jgi:23S rRNA pseudouridine2605 synthase
MADNDDKNGKAPRDGKPRFSGPKSRDGRRPDTDPNRRSPGARPAKSWGEKRGEGGGFKPRGAKPEGCPTKSWGEKRGEGGGFKPRGAKPEGRPTKAWGEKRGEGGGFQPRGAKTEGAPTKAWGEKRGESGFKPRGPKPAEGGADRPRSTDKFSPKGKFPREGRASSRPSALPGNSSSSGGSLRDPGGEEIGQSPSERIAKRLARAGIASRRDAETLIAAGRVKVNGTVLTSPAFNVNASDRIELDGSEIPPIERTRVFLFHKPAGVVTTNRDPEGRRTVFDVLPKDLPRLMTVGRLDINTEGLLLLTNDGGLARVLELPATGWLRRYRVRVHGKVAAEALAGLKDGMAVDGVFYGSIEASLDREQGTNAWLTIGLREGKNREVKNVLGALGLEVTRLIRVSYGPFQLGELDEGAVQELKGRMLRDQLGERLIEESAANFEAPVAKPFSNKPVHVRDEREAEPGDKPKPRIVRDGIQGRIGEGGLIKQRRRDPGDERASALSRLTTTKPEGKRFAKGDRGKPFHGKSAGDKPFAGKPAGGKPFAGRKDERAEPVRARTSNVWMAPGARPMGKGRDQSESPSPRSRGEGKGEGQRGPRKFGSKPADKGGKTGFSSGPRPNSDRERGPGRRGPGGGKGGADRRR